MVKLTEPFTKQHTSSWIVFSYPFRIFFLSVATWAILVVPLWLLTVTGKIELPLSVTPLQWHRHEMLFGLLNPAIAGFLLTAVCVWTNTNRLHGIKLFALWLVWISGRLAFFSNDYIPVFIIEFINLAFLPLVMLDASWRIRHAKQYKQWIIVLVLGLLWGMQMALIQTDDLRFFDAALVITILLMLVIGGRITPAFTINWLKRNGHNNPAIKVIPLLEKLTLFSIIFLFVATLLQNTFSIIILASVATICSFLRVVFWRGWLVISEPLLWILHISLLWIPVGLLSLSLTKLEWIHPNIWQHAIGIGAIGGLIIGVMTRVSLGHTGRELKLASGIVSAYYIIQIAAIFRVITAANILPWKTGLTISTFAWVIAFSLFLWRYFSVLTTARVDGREG